MTDFDILNSTWTVITRHNPEDHLSDELSKCFLSKLATSVWGRGRIISPRSLSLSLSLVINTLESNINKHNVVSSRRTDSPIVSTVARAHRASSTNVGHRIRS